MLSASACPGSIAEEDEVLRSANPLSIIWCQKINLDKASAPVVSLSP